MDDVDDKNKFSLTVKDEPIIQSKQESVSFIPHPPCSDEYIFIRVRFFEESRNEQNKAYIYIRIYQ